MQRPGIKRMRGVPSALGPYRFERQLGSGGMGEVYLAYDERLRRQVAIKRLRRDVDRPEIRARLRREARTLARLHHPSIVQCFDLIDHEEDEWLVMEYVDGPRITDLLTAGPLGLERALTHGRQVVEGLAEAHAHGIVHRDLKAENILIDRAARRAKILDFGLMREMLPDSATASLTHTGAMVGTLRAVAPEQARGLEVGPRADLFSFGVLLYEMLTGRSPFRASCDAETLSRLLAQPPEPLPAEVPAELAGLVMQLLEKLPELRPPDARVVARQLERLDHDLSEEETTTVGTVSTNDSTQGFPEFSRSVLGDAVPESTAMAAGGHRSHTNGAERSRPGARRAARTARTVIALLALGGGLYWIIGGMPPSAEDDAKSSDARRPGSTPTHGGVVAETASVRAGWEALQRYDLPGRIDLAIEIFQRHIASEPSSVSAHAGLARAYWRVYLQDSGDRVWLDQSLAVARHALTMNGEPTSEDALAHVSLGLTLIQKGELATAQREFAAALELTPRDADIHRGLAELHQAAGRLETAEAEFGRALALRPDDRELYDLLGTLHFHNGRFKEAEAAFRRSIAIAPDSVHGYRNLAGVHIARGEYAEAAALLESALTIRATATLHLNLGTIYFYQGLYRRAAASYERALDFTFGANFHVTWGNLGDAYRQIPHRRHEAPAAFRRAIRLLETASGSEADADKLSQLALYHAKAGLDEEARRSLESLDAEDPRHLFRMAIAWETLGERQKALELLAAALDMGLDRAEIEREPELLALRSDPRFHFLAEKQAQSDRASP